MSKTRRKRKKENNRIQVKILRPSCVYSPSQIQPKTEKKKKERSLAPPSSPHRMMCHVRRNTQAHVAISFDRIHLRR